MWARQLVLVAAEVDSTPLSFVVVAAAAWEDTAHFAAAVVVVAD